MASRKLVNTGSGSGLVPSGTRPLPETGVDVLQMTSSGIFFHRDSLTDTAHFKLQLHTTRANELNENDQEHMMALWKFILHENIAWQDRVDVNNLG